MIIFVAVVSVILILYVFRRRPFIVSSVKPQTKPGSGYSRTEAQLFVKRLADLGYFKWAAPEDVEELKENMIRGYNTSNELVSFWDDNSSTPKDFRYYFCDNEALFELGGFTDMLKRLQPTFDKMGLKIQVTDHYEVWDDTHKWLNHRITINGTNYIIFKNFSEMGWGQAVQRLVEIINSEIEKQNKHDRLYPAGGGNDGRIIFLSDEQFNLIDSVYKNPHFKPLHVKDWCEVKGEEYMNVEL